MEPICGQTLHTSGNAMTKEKSRIQLRVETDLLIDESVVTEESRRIRILSAAIQECAEVGYKNANMANVAKRASISTATLYRTFKDKTDLFIYSVVHVVQLLSEALITPISEADKFIEVKKMLINHGQAMGDPFLIWLYRLYVNSENDDNARALALVAKMGRTATEQQWQAQLMRLESQGYLRPAPYSVTINLLLGQIERQTILWNMMFGQEEGHEQRLEDASNFAAISLFANLGTKAFFNEYPEYRQHQQLH
jgi:AcrR family transcriptional regulator